MKQVEHSLTISAANMITKVTQLLGIFQRLVHLKARVITLQSIQRNLLMIMFPTTKIRPQRIEILIEKSQKNHKIRISTITILIELDSLNQRIQKATLLYYRLPSQCSILQQHHVVNSHSSHHTHLHNHLVFQNTTTTIFQTHLSCQNMSLFSLLIREYQSILRRN